MRAPAKARGLGARRHYRGCVLRRIGSVTVVVETGRGTVLGWATSFPQGRRFVDWIHGEELP